MEVGGERDDGEGEERREGVIYLSTPGVCTCLIKGSMTEHHV